LFSSFKYAILAVTKGNDMKNSEIYQIVTDRIISGLKLGKIAWKKTWRGGDIPKNFVTKKTYKGINVLILWYSMMINNYTMPYFLTFKQVSDLKGKVKKGSKSELIVYWQWIEGKEEKFNKVKNQWEKVKYPFLRYYRVFNIEQTEGINLDKLAIPIQDFKQIKNAENFIKDYQSKPPIQHGNFPACYAPLEDIVYMPLEKNFDTSEDYYSTLFHELIHSTGHKDRLNRDSVVNTDGFGEHKYSKEELIAEIGTAFICAITGISNNKLEENQQAYINNWIASLENDPSMIIEASAKAQKALNYIQGIKYTISNESDVLIEN